ncbi:MAG: hypothetical protein P8170_00330 [Gemmatimonadota bacterium]
MLRRTYLDAGLPEPTTQLEAQVEGGPTIVLYRYLAESVASMLPLGLDRGIEGFDDESVGALEDTLRAEVTRTGGVLVNWPVVSAWSTAPGP